MSDIKYASTDEGDVLLIFEKVPIDGMDDQDSNPEPVPMVTNTENEHPEPEKLEMHTTSEGDAIVAKVPDQSVAIEWNIENYRNSFETDEHWELRLKFMKQHKGSIPEDELVALAQAFSNAVLLNAVYSEELAARLNLLGMSIAEEYRNSRRQSITRIMVPASDAIADWQRQVSVGHKIAQQRQLALQLLKPVIPITSLEDVFHNFVLMDDNLDDSGREFGMLNCGLFVVRLLSQERKMWEANITAAGYLLSKSIGPKKKANRTCREAALQLLRRKCYKIKVCSEESRKGCWSVLESWSLFQCKSPNSLYIYWWASTFLF